jgi:hypothetical protein
LRAMISGTSYCYRAAVDWVEIEIMSS